jgi:hypothetical protein
MPISSLCNAIVSLPRLEPTAAIPPELFNFSPPPGSEDASASPRRGIVRSGGGGAQVHSDPEKYLEAWHSTEWDGETLAERCKLRLRGMDLAFERRLTFSEDGSERHIAERISGPKGQTQGDLTIPLGEKA